MRGKLLHVKAAVSSYIDVNGIWPAQIFAQELHFSAVVGRKERLTLGRIIEMQYDRNAPVGCLYRSSS